MGPLGEIGSGHPVVEFVDVRRAGWRSVRVLQLFPGGYTATDGRHAAMAARRPHLIYDHRIGRVGIARHRGQLKLGGSSR